MADATDLLDSDTGEQAGRGVVGWEIGWAR